MTFLYVNISVYLHKYADYENYFPGIILGKKRSYDSARYASLTAEQRTARQDRDRARRQSLTPEAREEVNAHRRSRMQSLIHEERQEKNARRRARRQSLPPEQRQSLLDRRKANYIVGRDTICAESIAMRCPELGASSSRNPSLSTPASTVGDGTKVPICINFLLFKDLFYHIYLLTQIQMLEKCSIRISWIWTPSLSLVLHRQPFH